MDPRPVLDVIARVSLAAALSSWLATSVAAAEPVEVGFVNLTADAAGQTAIASLRAELRGRADWRAAEIRPALESPRLVTAGAAPPALDLGAARAAYRRFDTGAALAALDAAEDERRHLSPSPALFAQLAEIALLRGQVLAGAGREDEAIAAFAAARALDPDRALDRKQYPPAVRALYQRSARGKRSASLTVDAPAGAAVWVDGKRAGSAPLEPMQVSAGPHLITAVLAGHRTESRWGSGDVAIAMAPLPARERAAALRGALSPRSPDLEILAEIAGLAGVGALVVVARRDGAIAVALYERRAGQLGPWMVPGPAVFGEGPAAADIAASGGEPQRPWYRRWWGISIIGGAAVLATVAVVAVVAGGPDTRIGGLEWR